MTMPTTHFTTGVAIITCILAGALTPTGNASAESRYFVARFMDAKLSNQLEDADAGFQLGNGNIRRTGDEGPQSANRHYVTTLRSDYASEDWSYEITFVSPPNAPDDILFIGVGEGVPDGEYFNEPQNSINFRIHQGEFAFFTGWRVDVAAHGVGYGVFTYFAEAVGYLPPGPDGGIFTARIRKTGTQATFEILDANPPIVVTIPDIVAAAPFLGSSASRIFFGNASGAYAYGDMRVLPAAVQMGE